MVDKIIDIIKDETTLTKVFSPMLPLNETNVCCVTLLGGDTINDLTNENIYNDISFRVLIRGNENDKDTEDLANEVFKALHLKKDVDFDDGRFINIIATSTPIFVDKDENQNNVYNITFNAKTIPKGD